jgi:hypothetical protein
VLWRIVGIEHPDTTFVSGRDIRATAPGAVPQFEPTVGMVILYPSELFGVQFADATSHGEILGTG